MGKIPPNNLNDLGNVKAKSLNIAQINTLLFEALSNDYREYSYINKVSGYDSIIQYLQYWKDNHDSKIIEQISRLSHNPLKYKDISGMSVSGEFVLNLLFEENFKKSGILLPKNYKNLFGLFTSKILSNCGTNTKLYRMIKNGSMAEIKNLFIQKDPELLSVLSTLNFELGEIAQEIFNDKELISILESNDLSKLVNTTLFKLNGLIKLPLFSQLNSVVGNIDNLINEASKTFTIKSFPQIIQSLLNNLSDENRNHYNSLANFDLKIKYLQSLNIDKDLNNLVEAIESSKDQEEILSLYLKFFIKNTFLGDDGKSLLENTFKIDFNSYKEFIESVFSTEKDTMKIFGEKCFKTKFNLRLKDSPDGLLKDFKIGSLSDLLKIDDNYAIEIDFMNQSNINNLHGFMKQDFVLLNDTRVHKTQKIKMLKDGTEHEGYIRFSDDILVNGFYLSKELNSDELYCDSKGNPIEFDGSEFVSIDTKVSLDGESIEKIIAINTFNNKYESLSPDEKQKIIDDYNKDIGDTKTNSFVNYSGENRNHEEFASEFFNINGDKSLDFVNFEGLNNYIENSGPIVLFFKLDDIKGIQGGSDWLKITISKVDTINKTFTAIFNGVEQELGSNEGLVQTLPLNGEIIANRKNLSYGSVFKSKQINSISAFNEYINNVEYKSDWKGIKSNTGVWKNLKQDGNSFKNSRGEKIEYLGKKFTKDKKDDYLSYKIEFKGDNVLVSHEQSNYHKLMDYASFIIFAGDKGLMPLSKDEKELNELNLMKAPDAPETARWGISVMTILSTFKTIKSNFTKKLDDIEDLRKVRFYKRFMNSASAKVVEGTLGVFTFGLLSEPFADLKMEGDTWLDEKIMGIIKTNRNKLGRDGSVNANIVADKIKDDVFSKKGIHSSNPLKAAGYFLNAIDSGGLYFRKLSPYAGTGSWVLALFGPDHQKKYLNEVKVLISQLEKDPLNGKLIEELSKIEYNYIKRIMCIPSFQGVYGTQIVGTMEGAFAGLNSKDSVNKVNADASAKVFADVFDDFKSGLNQFRVAAALGNLTALSTKLGDEGDYSNWYFSMLLPIVSGFSKFYFTDTHRKLYGNIGYTNGFPLAMYVVDAQGAYKLGKILDFVSKKAGLSDGEIFSKGSGWEKIKVSIDNGNYNESENKSKLGQFVENFEAWWKNHGEKIMPLLNIQDISNKNCAIFSGITDETVDQETKKILIDYVENKVTKDASEKFEFNGDYLQDGGLQYPKGLVSLSDGLVKKVMLDYNYDGRFSKGEAEYLWGILNDKITSLTTIGTDAAFDFMFNKFFVWFKSLTEKNRVEIIKTFSKLGDISDDNRAKNELNRLFEDVFKSSRSYNATIPVSVSKTINSYINYFVKNKNRFKKDSMGEYNLLNKTFTKDSVLAAIQDVRKDEIIRTLKINLDVSPNLLKNYLLSDLELLIELTDGIDKNTLNKYRTLIRALSEYEMGSVLEHFKSDPVVMNELLNNYSDEDLINELREKVLGIE